MAVKTTTQDFQWLNYHHLHYFFTIAQEGSIAKAAERLNIGQPTLSTQLKQLEESLGKPLFERSKQRLHLTESGRIAFEYAQQVFSLGAEMVEVLQDRLHNNRLHVQIGALDSVPKDITHKVIMQAYKAGNCNISVVEGSGDQLLRELENHQVDLLLSNYAPSVDFQSVYAKSIAKLPVVVCASEKYKHLKKNFPQSLEGQPFVIPTVHSKLRREIDHYFSVNRIKVDQVAEIQDTSLQTLLGAEGVGLIPVADAVAKKLTKDGKLIVLGTMKGVYEEIWLMAANRKIENPIAAQVMKEFSLN
ncbi:LysR family transcriptional regulator [Bdellovibrio sp. HCB209]|uniref:LysR family transcriptional regulator n=1 Tax=Bdellovibrio sp. HCB209 TaxID=3394354 RepID=UPI0039B4F13D